MPAKFVGTIVVEKDYPDEMTLMEALEAFGDEFDTDPETINGKVFVGICDGCMKIILEGETYAESEDDDIRCSVCIDKHQQELSREAEEQSSSPSSDDMHVDPDQLELPFVADSEDPEDQ